MSAREKTACDTSGDGLHIRKCKTWVTVLKADLEMLNLMEEIIVDT